MIYDDYLINDVSVLLVNDEELFTDEEIARVVESVDSINHALYILYTQKAGKVVNSNTAIKSIKNAMSCIIICESPPTFSRIASGR